MRDNRGLTLVEVLITVVILSIVVAVAASFMVTGSKSFVKGNAEANLQKEAELTANQIGDMIIDVNGGVDKTDDVGKTELVMYHETQDIGGTPKYIKETVVWYKSGDKMYYCKWNVTYDSAAGSYNEVADVTEQLLAENVSLFEVDLETADETASDGTTSEVVRSVRITVGYENSAGRVDYTTSPVITLRNRALLSKDPSEIFN